MNSVKIRPYESADWEAVCEIYDLSKPDEMRGGVDVGTIVPLQQDPSGLALFRGSVIVVAEDRVCVIGFGGHKTTTFPGSSCILRTAARELRVGYQYDRVRPPLIAVCQWQAGGLG